jgi:excisionase family DNA binding protein
MLTPPKCLDGKRKLSLQKEYGIAYRLEAGEMISQGMRRLLLERGNQIIDNLTNPNKGRDKGVHDARKNCKRIRAAYRLIRDEIGEDLYHQENIRFRDTARLLAGARDSWVMVQTLDKLVASHVDQLPPQAFTGVRQKLMEQYVTTLARELENQRTIPAIIETMHVACAKIENLPFQHEDFSAFRRGIQRVYTRGRRAMKLAYTQPKSEVFHEWRKRVKYLWYQLEILEALWPNTLSNLANELHTLSEYLGDDHDLAVLRWTILEEPSGFSNKQELMMLVGVIDKKRLTLEALARPLGERLYFDPPRTFTRRLETYWQAWQAEAEEYQADIIQRLHQASPTILRLDNAVLTTADMATHLQISPRKVRQLIHNRKLPAEKVGTIWIVKAGSWHSPDSPEEDAGIFDGVLLSTREAADHLNLTPDKIRKMIQSGQLPAIKAGRIWVIREGDLVLLLQSRSHHSGAYEC